LHAARLDARLLDLSSERKRSLSLTPSPMDFISNCTNAPPLPGLTWFLDSTRHNLPWYSSRLPTRASKAEIFMSGCACGE